MGSNHPVVILGAGLAGLSAAYHLQRPYKIFEANGEVGGVARSIEKDGFTFDHAIHVLFTKDPYASRLIRSLLGDNMVEQSRSSWIHSCGVDTPYPYQAHMRGLPNSVIEENLIGLIEARYRTNQQAPANFEEWVISTFGRGIAKHFMLPFNRKVWATEPNEMTADWINDRVMQPELHHIFEGAYRSPQVAYGPNALFWYPKDGGTSALPTAFASKLPPIAVGYQCTAIDSRLRTVMFHNGVSVKYDRLISTLPLPLLLQTIDNVPQEIRAQGRRLRSNNVITINLGIARPNVSEKHWIYFPEPDYEFHRVSFPANFSPTLVPHEMSSIMIEISESATRPIDRNGIVDRTLAQLVRAGVIGENEKIVCEMIAEIDPAYIIYDHAHAAATRAIHRYLETIGIVSCGRFGEWKYFNMDQAILSGKRAAECVDAS